MIALVISDVHANLEALDRVLEDAATRGYDEAWFLGDAVGYGAGYRCPRPMRVGIAAVGYGDGYPRHAPTGTPVKIAGQSAQAAACVAKGPHLITAARQSAFEHPANRLIVVYDPNSAHTSSPTKPPAGRREVSSEAAGF